MELSTIAYIGIIVSTLVSVALPIVTIIYLKNHHALSMRPIMVGALTWLLMTQVFENLLHLTIFTTTSMANHPWWYVLYGITTAALFEELGRYIAFTRFLKKCREFKDGMGYGLGHGGVESVVIGIIAMVQLYILANMLHNPQGEVEIPATPAIHFFLEALERICAIIIQIGLSFLVLLSVKKKQLQFLIAAIAAHMVIDLPPAMFQAKLTSLYSVYASILVFAAISGWGIMYIYKEKIIA